MRETFDTIPRYHVLLVVELFIPVQVLDQNVDAAKSRQLTTGCEKLHMVPRMLNALGIGKQGEKFFL